LTFQAPNGQRLFVDPASGDFRENLIPIQTAPCDGSAAQQWDVITEGKHNNAAGVALIVSSLVSPSVFLNVIFSNQPSL